MTYREGNCPSWWRARAWIPWTGSLRVIESHLESRLTGARSRSASLGNCRLLQGRPICYRSGCWPHVGSIRGPINAWTHHSCTRRAAQRTAPWIQARYASPRRRARGPNHDQQPTVITSHITSSPEHRTYEQDPVRFWREGRGCGLSNLRGCAHSPITCRNSDWS